MFIIWSLILFGITVFLFFDKKISIVNTLMFVIAIISFNLYSLNAYLALGVLSSLFLLVPFLNERKDLFERKDSKLEGSKKENYKDNKEELNYMKFKNFTNDYINLIKKDYAIASLVIYEEHDDFFKLLKLNSIENFSYARNIIDNDDPIFTALKQFETLNLTTSDKLLKNNAVYNSDDEIKVFIYKYKGYLIYIYYNFENLDLDIKEDINSFLYMFKDLKKQIVLKDYKRDLLSLSDNFNKYIEPKDILSTYIKSLKEYPSYDSLIFTKYKENAHFIHLIDSLDADILSYEGGFVESKNSIIDLAFKSNYPLPGSYKFDPEKNILFGDQSNFNKYKSLLVYPVQEQGSAVGTITLLSEEEGLYNKEMVEDLKLMFNMFDIAFLNAKNYKKMEEMATTDGLTGLVNHRSFQEKLSDYIARSKRYNKKVAVILSDIDHFKSVNDTYGHPMGDEVLRQVSKVLQKNVRDVDLVARYGGEEFVIVIEETSKAEVYALANRIREEIKALRFSSNQTEFNVTISMGFALFPDSGDNKQKIIDLSDKALYYSKKNGRDQVNCICDII